MTHRAREVATNEQTIVGNLTRDPEVHVGRKNARTVTTFDVAVNYRRFGHVVCVSCSRSANVNAWGDIVRHTITAPTV